MTLFELLDRLDGLDNETRVVVTWEHPGESFEGYWDAGMSVTASMDDVQDVVFVPEENAVVLVRRM